MSLPFCLPQLNRVSDSTGRIDQTVTRFGRIDILVNSAGAYLGKRAEDTSEEEWENGYIASRFGGMGIHMSVGAGEVMADLIVDSEVAFGVKKMIEHLSPD